MRKTYGIYGMIQYKALIPVKTKVVSVEFTGGSISGYGIAPATFTTDNEVLQHFIERSPQFKSGRVVEIRRP